MSSKVDRNDDVQTITAPPEVKRPKKYNVVFYNDDQTPMDFVVEVLCAIFNHSLESATEIMLIVHNEGRGVAGTYDYEIAEQKKHETELVARKWTYPLNVGIEPV